MKTIKLSRPKSEEKYYSEAVFKVYIGNESVASLKQGETKEIALEENDSINLQVKSRILYRSKIKTITPSAVYGLEVFFNPEATRKSYFVIFLIPLFTILFSNLGFSDIWGILSAIGFGIALLIITIYTLKSLKNGIIIREMHP